MKKIVLLLVLYTFFINGYTQVDTLRKKYYTDIFDEGKKVPLYAFYFLTREHIEEEKIAVRNHTVARTRFHPDPDVPADVQANNRVYSNQDNRDPNDPGKNIYERGHLAPDADFKFDAEAERSTMVYTNCAPQVSAFNEHLWANVEKSVRRLAEKVGKVKVYTGCIYGKEKLNGIPIPLYYWKVVFFNNTSEAFLGLNKIPESDNPNSIMSTAAKIELLTHIKFSDN
jgi:endonuclease G